ncbi:hypothetical protein KC351_g1747 [Hortaea werneckii]|nr:hypothetical protein KC351_g1747 [Hortaea werneckii]
MVSHNLQTASATTYETPRPGVEDTNLQQEHYTVKPVAQDTAHYSGEFSHWNFSERVREQLRERLPPSQADSLRHLEYWRATQLHPKPLQLPDLPPRTIAEFLVHSYFANAQTNVFLVTPDWTSTWLDKLYHPAYVLTVSDAPCVCSLLTILAIGSSFAHLLANDKDESTGTQLGPGEEAADEIVSHAIDSAHQTIDICREADSTIGLARASYVEFSSCRAAILLLLAHRLNQETATEGEKVAVGIQLMRNMTWTNMSAKSETSVIVVIDEAIKRSNTDVDESEDAAAVTQSPYASFLQWATEKRQQEKTVTSIEPVPPSEDSGMIEVLESFDWSLFDSPLSEMWAGPAMPHNPTT